MVIVGVARYIIKGYLATGVLFVGGLLLLIISAIMVQAVTVERCFHRLQRPNGYC
ncbi:hypothetical protein ACLB1Q_12180 [Escherichia coli]